MTLAEALDIVVARTGHARFRELCDPSHPAYRPDYIPVVLRMAGEPAPEPSLPPLASMAGNALGALARAAASGFAKVDDATRAARLAICEVCPQYRPSDGRCGACGCWCSAKAALSQEQCPEGRWPVDAARAAGDS